MKHSRRQFLVAAGGALATAGCATVRERKRTRRPNILLIMSDDQGYGDLSAHGNPWLKTPNLDRLRGEGVRFERFYVCPVCTPTRACLMTGRYNYRTRAIDTYLGRAMMDPEEVTAAQLLAGAGYRTGIFGKWHLGDHYPMRARDKGFQESLVHRGGGLVQPSDVPGNTYFSPVLSRNGEDWKSSGYCTDVFADAAIDFISRRTSEPFFCYLATNAPHSPLQIADEWAEPYRAMGLDERTANVYGMVANLDWNVGRVLDKLDELGLARDTLVIFLTDNGPQAFDKTQVRYNAGMRGAKGTVYEGGIRVPSFWRWPGTLDAGRRVDTMAANIDVLPTLLDLAGAGNPGNLDGQSLLPLLAHPTDRTDRTDQTDWNRYYFTQWHRGDVPERFRACAAVSQQYKLIDGKELYDLVNDPFEQRDIAGDKPDVAAEMRAAYERWFDDVSATRGYDPPRIAIGTPHENPLVLTRQDWRGDPGKEGTKCGHWLLDVATPGPYDITLTFNPLGEAATVGFQLGDTTLEQEVEKDAASCTFPNVTLDPSPARLDTWLTRGGEREGAYQIYVYKR